MHYSQRVRARRRHSNTLHIVNIRDSQRLHFIHIHQIAEHVIRTLESFTITMTRPKCIIFHSLFWFSSVNFDRVTHQTDVFIRIFRKEKKWKKSSDGKRWKWSNPCGAHRHRIKSDEILFNIIITARDRNYRKLVCEKIQIWSLNSRWRLNNVICEHRNKSTTSKKMLTWTHILCKLSTHSRTVHHANRRRAVFRIYNFFYQCAMRKYILMPMPPTSRICNSAILISILVDSHSPSFHRHPTYENNNLREERRRRIETNITKCGTVLGKQVRYNSIRSKVNEFTGTHTHTHIGTRLLSAQSNKLSYSSLVARNS